MNQMPPNYPAPESGGGWKVPALFGAVLALAGASVFQFIQTNKIKDELALAQKGLHDEIASVREASNASTVSQKQVVEDLRGQLASARAHVSSAAGQARIDAQKHADELAAKLAAAQRAQEAAFTTKTAELKQANEATSTRVEAVNTEVGAVKSEVATAKTELENQIANLKRVQGELGEQGSLIATNSKELSALRQLGERNYFEFRMAKGKTATRVGDIGLVLKKSDAKKNRFTIEVIADDKTVEKKDRTVNEPIQFMTSRARQPYEIVVNQVGKDLIAGYLATPKVQGR